MYEDGKPSVNKNVNYQLRNKSKAVSKRSGKSNGNGSFTISLDPLKGENGVLNLELDDKTYKYKNSFIIPSESQEFAVSFFP